MAGRKIFVGSLPDGCNEQAIRGEYDKFGEIEDVFVKANAEPGRQWAFVTYTTTQAAQDAKEGTDRQLKFPGAAKEVDVMLAKNQGKFGNGDQPAQSAGPKKIFVGSLPDSITEAALREKFSEHGSITDVYLKTGCEANKQWAFISFTSAEDAESAKTKTDRTLMFPDSEKPVEVMIAKNQGMNGQSPNPASHPSPHMAFDNGPKKVFVGSLPDDITEAMVRGEYSKYGHITDLFLKTGCDTNKQWAFITFSSSADALQAKNSTDRTLQFPNSTKACEVMIAKNQGRSGETAIVPVAAPAYPGYNMPFPGHYPGQPAPMPPHMSPWRTYATSTGVPYYCNHMTNQTQWECPPELHYQMHAQAQAHHAHAHHAHQAAMYGAMYGGGCGYPGPGYRPY